MQAIETRFNEKYKASPLVSDQSWLLALLAGAAFIFVMVVVFLTSFFKDIEISAWEVVGSIAPWYVAVISGWITYVMAPMIVAHGKTREFAFREWMTTGISVTVIGAVSMTVGYLLEYGIYKLAEFTGKLGQGNFFNSATDVHLIVMQYLLFFAVWFALGGFVGVSLYKSDDMGWISIPVAIALAGVAGTLGYSSNGLFGVVRWLVPSLNFDSVWLQLPIIVLVIAFGVYITRKLLRTLSLRNP